MRTCCCVAQAGRIPGMESQHLPQNTRLVGRAFEVSDLSQRLVLPPASPWCMALPLARAAPASGLTTRLVQSSLVSCRHCASSEGQARAGAPIPLICSVRQ